MRKVKPSTIFWNFLFILSLIIIGIFQWQILVGIELFLCLIIMGMYVFGELDAPDKNDSSLAINNNFWIFAVPITWLFFLIGFTSLLILLAYNNTILKFNKYLDKKFSKYE